MARALIDNLTLFNDINYLCNNKDNNEDNNEFEFLNSDRDKEKTISNKDNTINKYTEYIKQIQQAYMNNLYDIFYDIKENINSIKYKSPFDVDVTMSSILKTDFSSPEKDNKKMIPLEVLNIFLDFLNIIIKNKKIFPYFISKKFLELFSVLANDDTYKQIAYKLIQIFLNSPSNGLENKEKNKSQLLIIINRSCLFFPKGKSQDADNKANYYDEIYKLKELLLMQETISIYFNKKLIEIKDGENKSDTLNDKIIKFYCFYSEYINEHSKDCYQIYNDDYHALIKKYLNIIFKIIATSNQNIINKNNNYSPTNLKQNIKTTFDNILKFYFNFPDNNKLKKNYCFDIIKIFLNMSFNFTFSRDKINNDNQNNNDDEDENQFSEEDFTLYYINKYKINKEILEGNNANDNNNNYIISNFCIQSPMIILNLLTIFYKYNKYLNQYLHFILFLCKINQQNIIFLLKQNLIKKLFKILQGIPFLHDIIFEIIILSFKFLQKEDICILFEQLIKLSNNDQITINNNYSNTDFINKILSYFIKTLNALSISSNIYSKGILLSKYRIKQPNMYI
jgi:hypothetical protein